ncbi:MAG: hypothetical protein ACKVS6_00470, partial [Planctomycetota bacterium]
MKRLGKKILIFTCVLVVALAVAEFVTRAVVLSRSGGTSFEAYRLRCLGENIPIFEQDAEGELIDCKPSLSQGKRIHISSQGFRGKDVVDPKPTDTFRICFIGGSGCFGTTSSNDDSTIPAFFGARVRENAASPEKVDVINGGLPGAT